MDKVVIEVPKGQIAKVNKQSDGNVLVTFENIEHWKLIKSVDDACAYLRKKGICENLLKEYEYALSGSYTEKVAAYRIVIAALTDNEERHLTTGERWFPVIQFCKLGKEKNCCGDEILGTIKSEGQKYTVVGGHADGGASVGLGYFNLVGAVSNSWTNVSFQSVSRREIAVHLSKYFGRLLFEIDYAGVNCDWEWINIPIF